MSRVSWPTGSYSRLRVSPAVVRREVAFYLQAGSHSSANAFTHAMDDLFVIDGSVFPTACSVNPQISIYGLASWASEHVVEALG